MLKGKEIKVYDGDLIGWTTGKKKKKSRWSPSENKNKRVVWACKGIKSRFRITKRWICIFSWRKRVVRNNFIIKSNNQWISIKKFLLIYSLIIIFK